eukprot:TRINITY_DN2654_c0_g1_i1.p1 TRINITY_DN2654_c0_g1~~TRINITY_DN2654_c0_g1_i1.p1  ORF type:complete len:2219 (-),score=529.05 TRINITY_DN2654_c0_g1_i1:1486-8142(-)
MHQPETVREYLDRHGGTTVIEKILIANNGLSAVKGITSIRRWAYDTFGQERILRFVVMASPEDLRANAEFIRLADEYVEVPGGANHNNYANVDLIVDCAQRVGAHAVWAGWGHASENPALPRALAKTPTGIVFIGPGEYAMQALGDKISSTLLAQSTNVTCLPWSGSDIRINPLEAIPDAACKQASVSTVAEAVQRAEQVGFPLMIKASEGGGGKGIRKAVTKDDVAAAFRQVQSEVVGSPIFLMRLANSCRHLEVQVLGDLYGNVISLSGRDCSVQRRHQKILEEGPPTNVVAGVWHDMQRGAVRLAKAVGYSGLGTVEYLYMKETDSYCFLELNPRLQVEHPVTEMITNINLPSCQLQVAMGVPLYRIPEIRRYYGLDPQGTDPIDFDRLALPEPSGHCIAARITAENPDEGFKPTSGVITELTFRNTAPNVWGYFSMKAWGAVHEYADSQIGHIFARGANREIARRSLVLALKGLAIHGEIRTTHEYLQKLLEAPRFRNNSIDNTWLDGLIAERMTAERPDTLLAVLCASVSRASTLSRANIAEHNALLERGQIPPTELLTVEFNVELIHDGIKYVTKVARSGPTTYTVLMNESSVDLDLRAMRDGGMLIAVDGRSHFVIAKEEAMGLRVTIDDRTCVFTKEYDPSVLRSSMPGKLVRFLVEDGGHVVAQAPYAEVEVMKMYMPLPAPESGRVHFVKNPGAVLEAGDILATLELDDPTRIKRSIEHTEPLPPMRPPAVPGDKPHQMLQEAVTQLSNILNGYVGPASATQDRIVNAVTNLKSALYNTELPLMELEELYAVLAARIPRALQPQLLDVVLQLRRDIPQDKFTNFNAISSLIKTFADELPKGEAALFVSSVAQLSALCERYKDGLQGFRVEIVSGVIRAYLAIEQIFDEAAAQRKRRDHIITGLREQHRQQPDKVFEIMLSHQQLVHKNRLLITLMGLMAADGLGPYVPMLQQLAKLHSTEVADISVRAKHMLVRHGLPTPRERRERLEAALAHATGSSADRHQALSEIVDQQVPLLDVLVMLFTHPNVAIRAAALEVYVRRAYRVYEIQDISTITNGEFLQAEWRFMLPLQTPSQEKEMVMHRNDSYLDMQRLISMEGLSRVGVLVVFDSFEHAPRYFQQLLRKRVAEHDQEMECTCEDVLNVVLRWDSAMSDEDFSETFAAFLLQYKKELVRAGFRRVTFVVACNEDTPRYFTYRKRNNFQEDLVYRHVDPPLAFQLELRRLANYNITAYPMANPEIHVYCAEERDTVPKRIRFFVRTVVRQDDLFRQHNSDVALTESEHVTTSIFNALELAMGDRRYRGAVCNHVFMNFIPAIPLSIEMCKNMVLMIAHRHVALLIKTGVAEVEVKLTIKPTPDSPGLPYRLIVTNPSRYEFKVDAYLEVKSLSTGLVTLHSVSDSVCQLHGGEVTAPYPKLEPLQLKRLAALTMNTTYVYDFLVVIEKALAAIWTQYEYATKAPKNTEKRVLFSAVELVLGGDGNLVEEVRPVGTNNVGMVVWRMVLHTPEYPAGRPVIVIANDITFLSGSFGPREDELFLKASMLARAEGIPRLYIAANSGARIGLAKEVMDSFCVKWADAADPVKGFEYLSLPTETFKTLQSQGAVQGQQADEANWRLTDIIGLQDGLGVENLRGSGMIAGETSRAYDEIFTVTLVTGRTVGIGAYLVRLGQRTVQNQGPIILTGAEAINKLLGRDVYVSNLQLGGPRIMHCNGVSHDSVENDFRGIRSILEWLSYVPLRRGDPLPLLPSVDPVERPVLAEPSPQPHDPRLILTGYYNAGEFQGGFFDKDSFVETLAGWARTVIAGRARLGGMPIGVIAVETRMVEAVIPADPATPDSQERVLQQAGQVWFPDSAYKTAQAIEDMNKEGLPLIIFANWRGFSGGMRDMFHEILKFGSYIVDALVAYKQPVMIYIPPHGELRGGAWVVVDPTINADMMEMYADPGARGGVLEPSGTIEIKYRKQELIRTMRRLDAPLRDMHVQLAAMQKQIAQLQSAAQSPMSTPPASPVISHSRRASLSFADTREIETRMKSLQRDIDARVERLLPVYTQIALKFADLHDTPGRMCAKGAITDTVPWRESRVFFYWRLRRRLAEEELVKRLRAADKRLDHAAAINLVHGWLADSAEAAPPAHATDVSWRIANDKAALAWLESSDASITSRVNSIAEEYVAEQTRVLASQNLLAVLRGAALAADAVGNEALKAALANALASVSL